MNMIEKTMIQVNRDIWKKLLNLKRCPGDTHNDVMEMLIDFYHKTSRKCDMCGEIFQEEDIDMYNGSWLCRNCEDVRG